MLGKHKNGIRIFSLCLTLTLLCLTVMEAAAAPSIPKPSVPEFTINLIDSSYDTKPTSTTDPYTGQTITYPSQHIELRTIELKIKRMPFTSFQIENESQTYTVNLYYNVRLKGHFESEWREIYTPTYGYAMGEVKGDYCVISYEGNYSSEEGLVLYYAGGSTFSGVFPPGAQVDFQVQALIGYIHHVVGVPVSAEVFEGETSGWSRTQTLTISEGSVSTVVPGSSVSSSQNPPSEPLHPGVGLGFFFGLGWVGVVVVSLLVVVLLVVLVFLHRRR